MKIKNDIDSLIIDNMALIGFVVKKNFYKCDIEYEELVSIGTIGLVKAANTFDDAKEIKFSGFAIKCIYNEILMSISRETSIKNCISSNTPIKEDESLSIEDVLVDDNNDFLKTEDRYVFDALNECINCLDETSQYLIRNKFRFFEEESKTQVELGLEFGLSQASISRLTIIAVNKIRKKLINDYGIDGNDLIFEKKIPIDYTRGYECLKSISSGKFNQLDESDRYLVGCYFGIHGYSKMTSKGICEILNIRNEILLKRLRKIFYELCDENEMILKRKENDIW